MPDIPTTLDEAFEALDEMLPEKRRNYLQKATNPERVVIALHHSFGRHLRNEWRLWQDSELAKHLKEEHGIKHPDDMSGFILRQYCRDRYPTVWDRVATEDDGA